MKIRVILGLCLGLAVALGACFDSLVSDSCSAGFGWSRGACTRLAATDAGDFLDGNPTMLPDGALVDGALVDGALVDGALVDGALLDGGVILDGLFADSGPVIDAPDAMSDAPADAMVDGPPDAMVCTMPTTLCRGLCVDTSTDPDNCGACDHVCATGVCALGACTGAVRGQVVAIGHDYRSHHAAMARVLGNSTALGVHGDVGIARLRGTADTAAIAGTSTAISSSMAVLGRAWHNVTLPATGAPLLGTGIDVLVVDAQLGDGAVAEALGTSWRTSLTNFLTRGGVIIVLEGANGVSYRFALGANLYTIAAPIDATGQLAVVSDGADATTQQVLSPYLAETTSVTLPGPQHAAITTIAGATVVFHFAR
jgi:Stigma-specific protein, Stig1